MSQVLLTVLPRTQGRELEKMEHGMVENGAVNEEEEEEEEAVYTFTVYEIDLDYEFDAARFFDFTREESPLEARQVEAWFDSAGSYPPSHQECRNQGTHCNVLSIQDKTQKLPSGLSFYNHMVNNVNPKNQSMLLVKPSYHRTPTFMKPTLSHLAEQNRPFQTEYSRSHMVVLGKPSKISASTCLVENQAAKRQKVDSGLLRKVGAVQLQQANFVHKAPKRDKFLCGNPTSTKPRINIPIEPDLETAVTAHRAQRTMEKSIQDGKVNSTMRRFKDLPLSKKILGTPVLLPKRSTPCIPDFQEFQLKMPERAMQHDSAILKPRVPLNHPSKVVGWTLLS